MEFVAEGRDVGAALDQAQALIHQMEATQVKDNLKSSLQLLQRNALLLEEIKRLGTTTGEEAATRAKAILEVNANILELCRLYESLS